MTPDAGRLAMCREALDVALGAPAYNSSFGGDPAPGEHKQLVIRYVLDGRAGEVTFAEDATIVLAVPPATP